MAYLPPLNGGRINASIGGNTAGATALVSSGTMLLAGGNNITLSQDANSITLSGANQTVQTQGIQAISAGVQIATSGTVSFVSGGGISWAMQNNSQISAIVGAVRVVTANGSSMSDVKTLQFNNANGITFGFSTGAGIGTITASHNALTTQSYNALQFNGSTANSTMPVRWLGSTNGSGNITMGLTGSTVTASYSQTNQTVSAAVTGNTAGNTAGMSVDARNLTFQGLGLASVGLSTSAGGSSIIVSGSQSVQTQGLQSLTISGNVAGVGANISSGAVTLAGGNNITLSQNGDNAVTIIGGTGGGAGGIALANSQATYNTGTLNLLEGSGAITIASSAGGQSFKFNVPQTSSLSATGAVSISANGSTISIGAPIFDAGISTWGNTAGTTGTVNNGIMLAGLGSITLSQSTDSNGATITFNDSPTATSYFNMLPASTNSQTLGAAMGATNGTAQFFPISIASNVQFNALRVAMNFSFVSTSISGNQSITHSFGLYSKNANTLSLISSNSLTYNASISSVSATLSAATATGTGGYSYGSITASTTAQINSLFGSLALRPIDLQFGNSMSITPGIYWLGFIKKESSSLGNAGLNIGIAGNAMALINSLAPIGTISTALTGSTAYKTPFMGWGPYNASSAGLPSSAAFSNISAIGSIMPFVSLTST